MAQFVGSNVTHATGRKWKNCARLTDYMSRKLCQSRIALNEVIRIFKAERRPICAEYVLET